MRKEWRRQKKAKEAAKKSAELALRQQQDEQLLQQPPPTFPFPQLNHQQPHTSNTNFIPNNMAFGHFY